MPGQSTEYFEQYSTAPRECASLNICEAGWRFPMLGANLQHVSPCPFRPQRPKHTPQLEKQGEWPGLAYFLSFNF
jgi:hypothetical protein